MCEGFCLRSSQLYLVRLIASIPEDFPPAVHFNGRLDVSGQTAWSIPQLEIDDRSVAR